MASRRPAPESEGITTARLDGTARRLLREHADHDTAIAELHTITTDPRLLGLAAGTALGAWQATRSYDSDRVARMLTAAGADLEVRDHQAAVVVKRLSVTRPGIGNP